MSRSAALIVALTVSAVAHAETPAMERYRAMTSVEPHCDRPADAHEIMVCGVRRADRWRVPFVGYDAGDPRIEDVHAERARLVRSTRPPCGQGAIIADCGGMVGVSVSSSVGRGGVGALKLRPLAP
jgi:hypothetical protein